MRSGADRAQPGRLVRAGAALAAAGCLLAACSSPAKPGPSRSLAPGSALSRAGQAVIGVRGPGGGSVV
ncbi:MAG: hypothetical protein ACRDPO_30830, partial [Streptosporangiaceae bacterium]